MYPPDFKLLNNRWKEVTILIEGYRCMIMTDILYRDLTQAIQSKYNYTDRDNLKHEHDETEAILREMDEEYRLEQEYLMRYNPKEYKRQMDDASYKRRISMVGNLFNIQGTEVGDAKLLAFEMIYKKYFSQTSTYFTHIVSLLVFLERQSYNYSSSEIKECAQNLCDNLTYCEKELLLQYAEYHPNSKKIINSQNEEIEYTIVGTTEVDLSQIDNDGLKRVVFVVTTVNRFRQESAVVDRVGYMF